MTFEKKHNIHEATCNSDKKDRNCVTCKHKDELIKGGAEKNGVFFCSKIHELFKFPHKPLCQGYEPAIQEEKDVKLENVPCN